MSKNAQDKIEIIKALGQLIISILIVAGGLAFMYAKPQESGLVGGFVGTVIAYYFLSANQAKTVKRTVAEVMGSDDSTASLSVLRSTINSKPGMRS